MSDSEVIVKKGPGRPRGSKNRSETKTEHVRPVYKQIGLPDGASVLLYKKFCKEQAAKRRETLFYVDHMHLIDGKWVRHKLGYASNGSAVIRSSASTRKVKPDDVDGTWIDNRRYRPVITLFKIEPPAELDPIVSSEDEEPKEDTEGEGEGEGEEEAKAEEKGEKYDTDTEEDIDPVDWSLVNKKKVKTRVVYKVIPRQTWPSKPV